jgi:predicted RNase H-like nuclease (RuvC/YqgF family)
VRKISLLALASSAKIEDFSKITASIEAMVSDLKKEQDDEVAHQRFCTEELSQNAAQQEAAKEKIADLTAEIDEKSATVETLASEISVLQEQVTEMNKQLKRASEDRELANKEFQLTVADQRATQEVLERVLDRLGKVYAAPEKGNATEAEAFVQTKQPEFGAYSKNEAGGGVMSLIQEIMHEAVTLEKEGILAEQNAQNDYTAFVTETAKSIGAANRSISAKASAKADLEQAIVAASADKAATVEKLMDLGKYETELHSSCDYVLKNFDLRQEARKEEMDALNSAKAILAGAGSF